MRLELLERGFVHALAIRCTWLAMGLVCWLGVAGCASKPKLVSHSFSCHMWNDGWATQADLLEYSYGDKFPMLHKRVREGQDGLGCGGSVNAPMPVGEFLYVKWRLKATGEVIEDRVDLRGRLPQNMYMQKLTFLIDGRQLYVYLVTNQEIKQRLSGPPLKTWLSQFYVTHEVYPNNELKR